MVQASTWSRCARARASCALRARRPARRRSSALRVRSWRFHLLGAPARRIRSHRQSPDSRCSGSSCRKYARGSCRGWARRRALSSSCAVSSMAGVQKPHCSALRAAERVLQVGDRSAVRHALDGLDLRAVALHRKRQAAAHDHAVDAHRAGAAHAVLAADMAAGKAQRLAQEVDQRHARLDASRRPLRRYRQRMSSVLMRVGSLQLHGDAAQQHAGEMLLHRAGRLDVVGRIEIERASRRHR